jgi:hypothetical protein
MGMVMWKYPFPLAEILSSELRSSMDMRLGVVDTPLSAIIWKRRLTTLRPATSQEGSKPGFQSNETDSPVFTAGQAPETNGMAWVGVVAGFTLWTCCD